MTDYLKNATLRIIYSAATHSIARIGMISFAQKPSAFFVSALLKFFCQDRFDRSLLQLIACVYRTNAR